MSIQLVGGPSVSSIYRSKLSFKYKGNDDEKLIVKQESKDLFHIKAVKTVDKIDLVFYIEMTDSADILTSRTLPVSI